MIHHASLPVANLERSAALYDAALGALGYRRVLDAPGFAGYGADEGRSNHLEAVIDPPLRVKRKGFLRIREPLSLSFNHPIRMGDTLLCDEKPSLTGNHRNRGLSPQRQRRRVAALQNQKRPEHRPAGGTPVYRALSSKGVITVFR